MASSTTRDSLSDIELDSSVTDQSQLESHLSIGKPWSLYTLEKKGKFDELLREYKKEGKMCGCLMLERFKGKGRSYQSPKDLSLDTIMTETELFAKTPLGPWNDFQLGKRSTQSTLGALLDLETEDEEELDKEEFLSMLESGEGLGAAVEEISLPPLRKFFKIGNFRPPIKVPNLQYLHNHSKVAQFDKPTLEICTAGAPTTVRTPLLGLVVSQLLYRGAARTWFIVPPSQKKSLEEHIRLKFFGTLKPTQECSQFIRHLGLWLDTTTLEKWGVEYREVKQEAGQLLILLPGCYYWGFSHGFGVAETRYFAAEEWSESGYRFCKEKWEMCGKQKELLFNLMKDSEMADRGSGIAKKEAAKLALRKPIKQSRKFFRSSTRTELSDSLSSKSRQTLETTASSSSTSRNDSHTEAEPDQIEEEEQHEKEEVDGGDSEEESMEAEPLPVPTKRLRRIPTKVPKFFHDRERTVATTPEVSELDLETGYESVSSSVRKESRMRVGNKCRKS